MRVAVIPVLCLSIARALLAYYGAEEGNTRKQPSPLRPLWLWFYRP
jgi:hypothetical protein